MLCDLECLLLVVFVTRLPFAGERQASGSFRFTAEMGTSCRGREAAAIFAIETIGKGMSYDYEILGMIVCLFMICSILQTHKLFHLCNLRREHRVD
jgi:hypothetical protein